MPTQKKIETVKKLTDKVSRAKAIIVADYRGLKHKQCEEIRKMLKKLNAEFVVAKNRLMIRALNTAFSTSDTKGASHSARELADALTGTTATLFAYADEVAPLKELMNYFNNAGAGKTKAGLLGTHLLSNADVTRLASLPTRDALLGTLVRQLTAPIHGLHYALSWHIKRLVWALNTIQEKQQHT